MIMICGFKTAKTTIVQYTVNQLHVATPDEQLHTTVHVSFLLQLTVLTSSILRCLEPVMHLHGRKKDL